MVEQRIDGFSSATAVRWADTAVHARYRRRWVRFLSGVVGLLAGCAVWLLAAAPADATTTSFTSAGCQTWSVPTGVTSVQVDAVGSAGQTAGGSGGNGDEVSGTLSGL